jgi:hypothetical protein
MDEDALLGDKVRLLPLEEEQLKGKGQCKEFLYAITLGDPHCTVGLRLTLAGTRLYCY